MSQEAWPVVPIKFCEHLKGKKPSQVTAAMLKDIGNGGKLEACAARAWAAMKHAAMCDGVKLSPTSAGDTYRSIATQKAGFMQRFQLEPIAGATTRTYEGKTWYLKKGMAVLASPVDDAEKCSRHMLGIAVDVANASGVVLAWLIANEQRFGFSHEVVKQPGAEPWHVRFTEGHAMPQAVLDYEATLGK